jgi:hypothetical protein
MLTFNRKYFYLTLILFLVEVYIAVFIKDSFVRPFIGDVLVVILIYCLARTFCSIRSSVVAFLVLIFAYSIEILQHFNLVHVLGLQRHSILAIALGSTFDWQDIGAYTIGTAIILLLENKIRVK